MAVQTFGDELLTDDLLAHFEVQLESAQRMLSIVSEQGAAIRRREVGRVVELAGALQVEIHRREVIESERGELLERAGAQLGVDPAAVTMTMLRQTMDPDAAQTARGHQRELRGLLRRIRREHATNRALMSQELAFLDHLLRLAGRSGGYGASGRRTSTRRATRMMGRSALDLEA
jgi:hypothetical protein